MFPVASNSGENLSKVCENSDLLSNSPKRSSQFSPSYEGTQNMFYFLSEGHYITTTITKKFLKCDNYILSTFS